MELKFLTANFYPYFSCIQKHLAMSQGLKTSELTSEMYYKDSKPDDFSTATNPGFKSRYDLVKSSQPFEMLGRICSSIFLQKRYLPTNVDVNIVLRRNPPEFSLLSTIITESGVSGVPFKVKIEDAVLYVRKHTVNPQISRLHQSQFSNGKRAIFPVKRTDIKSICLPTGSLGTTGDVLFNGILPDVLTIGFVSTKALTGAIDKNPFNFEHFNLTNIAITVDNDTAVYRSLSFGFGNHQFLQGYNTLFHAFGYENDGNFIERTDYPNGNTLIVFDLLPSIGSKRHQLERVGQVKIELKFSEALAAPINIIAHAQFQSYIQIDKNRNIILDLHG